MQIIIIEIHFRAVLLAKYAKNHRLLSAGSSYIWIMARGVAIHEESQSLQILMVWASED
jgi:hypothetical protein